MTRSPGRLLLSTLLLAMLLVSRGAALAGDKSHLPLPPINPYEKPIKPRPAPDKPPQRACKEILRDLQAMSLGSEACEFGSSRSGFGYAYRVSAGPDTRSWVQPDRDAEFWNRFGQIARSVAVAHKGVQEVVEVVEIRLWGVDYSIALADVWSCGSRPDCYAGKTTIGR